MNHTTSWSNILIGYTSSQYLQNKKNTQNDWSSRLFFIHDLAIAPVIVKKKIYPIIKTKTFTERETFTVCTALELGL